MRGLLKETARLSESLPAPAGAGPARRRTAAGAKEGALLAQFDYCSFPGWVPNGTDELRVSLEIPWVCLQIRPVLGAVAFRINARRNPDSVRQLQVTCRPPPVAPHVRV